ncbi:hypothetical protein ISU07_17855 [Nocardioides islandensis]|uniref:Uncharacterized protein n=1 Tax=Nocardioides islandensis TaxID=433663 RepID=A0A930YLW1_9ACTN|nr:hypothetical protein [Nocardioides islandensis]MBF4765000.1 hypothetical protein [Nocardioides islandensis]
MSFLNDAGSAALVTPDSRVRAATWPGYTAVITGCCSAAMAFLGHANLLMLGLGYVLGAVITPVLAVFYRVIFENRRKDPWFVRSTRPGRVMTLGVLFGVAAGMVNAWLLATEFAKR